ncbi:hypothetical protein JCM18902_1401 [Psychrobacter sp. JCM 18902]|nr:hypothetical protein JCM18902_1401 [Psychrobacter sp. JCM 18902]
MKSTIKKDTMRVFFMKKRFITVPTNRQKAFKVSIIFQQLRTHEYFGNQSCCANLNDCLFAINCV